MSSCTSLGDTSIDSTQTETDASSDANPAPRRNSPPPLKKTSMASQHEPQPSAKRCYSACRFHSLDRSLPNYLEKVPMDTAPQQCNPVSAQQTKETIHRSKNSSSRKAHERSRHTSGQVYGKNIFESQAGGLCYADIVNQGVFQELETSPVEGGNTNSAIGASSGHVSRLNESREHKWLTHRIVRGIDYRVQLKSSSCLAQRSVSSGPMVDYHSTLRNCCDETITVEKFHRNNKNQEEVLHKCLPYPTDGDAEEAQLTSSKTEVGRFTVTSSSSDAKPSVWCTHSDDLWQASTQELSASHSTLDNSGRDSATREHHHHHHHISSTTPTSPTKNANRTSPCFSSFNSPLSRRVSFGDQPQEFAMLQPKTSDDNAMIHTSLDSVRADRAQTLRDSEAPVAQWLMEYFDQIEKARWTYRSRMNSDDGEKKSIAYVPILSAHDYLKSGGMCGNWVDFSVLSCF